MPDESPPSLLMSQLIANDAPLLSPLSATDPSWDSSALLYNDSFNYNYFYPSPPNSTDSPPPPPAPKMLKSRTCPVSSSEQELCLPTHEVFSFTPLVQAQLPPSPAQSNSSQSHPTFSKDDRPPSSASSAPSSAEGLAVKRSSAIPTIVTKKPRSGERVSVKDFVPPDVTGLTKREARLVKNRAAAFLSRQRKREEFENMEIHVVELEQENARLLALTQNGNSCSHPNQHGGELVSEIEELRAQLATARDRERELSAELASKDTSAESLIKVEAADAQFQLSPQSRASSNLSPSHRSGASLGLMVLLCTLPSLLSLPVHGNTPTAFSDSLPTSNFDYNSYLYDWMRVNGQAMMDTDEQRRFSTASASTSVPISRKLQFTDVDIPALAGLGGLDISFDALPSEDGKIRVRIHPPSSAESLSGPGSSSSRNAVRADMWSAYQTSSNPFSSSYPPASKDDPFFGIGMPSDYGMLSPISSPSSTHQLGPLQTAVEHGQVADSTFAYESQFSTSNARRVRISLKSLPVMGAEGGEWEVQIC